MNKPITIAHIHVWDKLNKGDVGIVLAVQEQLNKHFPNCTIQDYPIEILQNYDTEQLALLNAADVIIMGGGGVLYSYFLPFNVQMIEAITKPLILFGIGYIQEIGSPRPTDVEFESIIALTTKATIVSVREYNTFEMLKGFGIDEKKLMVIGDPAVLLSETQPKNIPENNNIAIGLNINYSGWLGFGKYQNEIINSYQRVAEYFQKNHNATIYYAQHHPGETDIYPKLNIRDLVVLDYPAREQKYVYGTMEILIGMMLHSCVMAFGAGTPEINVGYDIRNKAFADFIDHPELHIAAPDLNTELLLDRVITVFENRAQYKQSFQEKISHIQKKHAALLTAISKVINY